MQGFLEGGQSNCASMFYNSPELQNNWLCQDAGTVCSAAEKRKKLRFLKNIFIIFATSTLRKRYEVLYGLSEYNTEQTGTQIYASHIERTVHRVRLSQALMVVDRTCTGKISVDATSMGEYLHFWLLLMGAVMLILPCSVYTCKYYP